MTKKITRAEVLKIAKLARLRLTDEETVQATEDLQQMLDYVQLLNEVDTQDVEPMTRVIDEIDRFREDENLPSLDRETIMKNAPKTDGECFLVPPVLEPFQ